MNDMIAICNGFFKIWEKQFQSKNIIYSTDFYFLIDAIASLSYSVLRAMMPWDTRPYARSGGERNPSTATVSVTRQKQTHRSYPEHHPYSTATITSATARQTQETEKKFINAYSILYIFTKLLWIKIYCNNISPSGIRRNFRNLKNHIMSKYIIIPIIFTSTIVYGDNQKFNEYANFCEKMIVTLQSCTDEKSTFSHSSEFPIILYTVLNENPLKDFF